MKKIFSGDFFAPFTMDICGFFHYNSSYINLKKNLNNHSNTLNLIQEKTKMRLEDKIFRQHFFKKI